MPAALMDATMAVMEIAMMERKRKVLVLIAKPSADQLNRTWKTLLI